MNTSLLSWVEAEIRRLRALQGPGARFVANQLERTAQLLRFTGADSERDFDARIECNDAWMKQEAYDRGYSEGRSSALHEVGPGRYLPD